MASFTMRLCRPVAYFRPLSAGGKYPAVAVPETSQSWRTFRNRTGSRASNRVTVCVCQDRQQEVVKWSSRIVTRSRSRALAVSFHSLFTPSVPVDSQQLSMAWSSTSFRISGTARTCAAKEDGMACFRQRRTIAKQELDDGLNVGIQVGKSLHDVHRCWREQNRKM